MSDESEQIDQDEIEALLQQAQSGSTPAPAPVEKPPEEESLGQNDIEALFAGGGTPAASTPQPATPAPPQAASPVATVASPPPSPADGENLMDPSDIDFLLNQAESALASLDSPTESAPPGLTSFELKDFKGAPANAEKSTIDLVRDVELDVKIELGQTQMYLEDVLKMRKGSVVALDKLAGDPVDIFVNGRLIARGEVLVLSDNFCVRIAELIVGDKAA
ncbi:MAG: flagellar motor switch protein FliN [Blastopirellula sp.]|nr:MAG: flagellar motor switch protein FliN [Blastopirellula sp.]